jgi:hypothetical protein
MKDPEFVHDLNDTEYFGPWAVIDGDYPRLKWEVCVARVTEKPLDS